MPGMDRKKILDTAPFNKISVKSTSLGLRTVEAVSIRSLYSVEMHDLMKEPESDLIRHITNIEIPEHDGVHYYRYRASGYRLGNIVYAMHYSDEISGISGGGDRKAGIIAKFVLSGELRLESGKTSLIARPGQACFFDTQKPWKFWKSQNTRYRWVLLPEDHLYRKVRGWSLADRPVIVENSDPEARLALSFLQMLKSQNIRNLSDFGLSSSEEAASLLLSSIVTRQTSIISSRDFDNATLIAAQRFIDANLTSFDLSPVTIAKAISVSLRTLHRSFSEADLSVMGYVRARRIQEARNDLDEQGNNISISAVAAKYNFSDASHFIRQFKGEYGMTPAVYVRSTLREKV